MEKDEIIEQLIKQLIFGKVISITKIQRYFRFGYSKSKSVIDSLLMQGVLEKVEQGYLIIKEQEFVEQLNKILSKYGV